VEGPDKKISGARCVIPTFKFVPAPLSLSPSTINPLVTSLVA